MCLEVVPKVGGEAEGGGGCAEVVPKLLGGCAEGGFRSLRLLGQNARRGLRRLFP